MSKAAMELTRTEAEGSKGYPRYTYKPEGSSMQIQSLKYLTLPLSKLETGH